MIFDFFSSYWPHTNAVWIMKLLTEYQWVSIHWHLVMTLRKLVEFMILQKNSNGNFLRLPPLLFAIQMKRSQQQTAEEYFDRIEKGANGPELMINNRRFFCPVAHLQLSWCCWKILQWMLDHQLMAVHRNNIFRRFPWSLRHTHPSFKLSSLASFTYNALTKESFKALCVMSYKYG